MTKFLVGLEKFLHSLTHSFCRHIVKTFTFLYLFLKQQKVLHLFCRHTTKIRPSAKGRWSYFWVPLPVVAPPQGDRTYSGQVKCGEAGHSVQAARFRSASVPYGLPCRIKYDDAEHRHRPAVSCIQFAFFSFAISSAIWRHMSLRNFTSSSRSSMRERGTSFS